MAGTFEGIKTRKFGIEIEMTGLTRSQAAKAVAKAVAPVRKAAGLPTNLNDDGDPEEDPVQKSEPHYLAGIL